MTKELKEKHPYLICPVSRGDLFFVDNREALYCPESGITYPIYKNVPVMIPSPEFLNPSEEYFEDFKKKLNKRNFLNYFNRRWNALLDHTNLQKLGPGSKILENGAGQGYATKLFRERTGADVHAIDYSMASCLKAHEHLGNDTLFYQADSCSLPFRDEYFDFVIGNALLHHIDDQKKAVDESVRVCQKGGYVVFIEPNRFHPIQVFIALKYGDVEKGTLKMDQKKIKKYFIETGRVSQVKLVPIFTILFAYQSFPSDTLFPLLRAMEPLFDQPFLCTNYIIIAHVSS